MLFTRPCTRAAVAASLVSVLFAAPTLADGFAFKHRDMTGIMPLYQNEQRATIRHHDGVQHMLIAINVDLADDERGVWIFPLPAAAEETSVELIDQFPRFFGRSLHSRVAGQVHNLAMMVRLTQVWTLFMCEFLPSLATRGDFTTQAGIDRWGLQTDVVTTDTADGLAAYLATRNYDVQPADLDPFESYFGDEFVFVVTTLQSADALRAEFTDLNRRHAGNSRWPTLTVSFPAEQPFYPMRPTSAYAPEHLRVTLYLIGSYVAVTAKPLEQQLRHSYYELDAIPAGLPPAFTDSLPAGVFGYTRVRTNTSAGNFVDDIRFESTELPGVAYARILDTVTSPPVAALSWVASVLILSYFAAGVSGLLVFRRWHRPALFGLMNIFTILAMWLHLRRKPATTLGLPSGNEPTGRATLVFLAVFSMLFVIETWLLAIALSIPLG